MSNNERKENLIRPYTCYINRQGVIPSRLFKGVESNKCSIRDKFNYEDQAKTYR